MKKLLFFIILIPCFKIHAQTPTISSFSPTSGTIGTLITINGTNLSTPTAISIGGVAAIKISASSNTLVAMVMPGTSTGNIYVSNATGNVTSGASFTKIANGSPSIQQGAKLVGTGAIGNSFQGTSVSLSADGNTAIVGGAIDSNYIGAAWIYVRSSNTWAQQGGKLVGTGASSNSLQGNAVALSADGNTAIVGGYYDNNGIGAAWVFTRNGNTWTQQGSKLIGTGAIGQCWQGYSVALSADGNTAIIGGSYDSIAVGAAWVFTRSGNTWTQQGNKLVGSGRIGWTNQGTSVSLSADGNTAMVGGYRDNNSIGAAWIFTRIGSTWTQQGSKLVGTGAYLGSLLGTSVSLSADGNTAMLGGYWDDDGTGAVWAFTRSGNNWTQQGNKLVGTGAVGRSFQGYSVSLSADGNIAVVGGFGDNTNIGATWIFARSGNSWTQIGNKLLGTGGSNQSQQGASVSISADGNTVIVGGNYDSTNNIGAGAAWVFYGSSNNSQSQLNLKAYLQGLYLGNGKMVASPRSANGISPANISDTLTIELRNTTGAYSMAYSAKATIDTTGNASISFPSAALGNSYYIVVKHRNSVETWSASPVLFSTSASYDFSTSASQAFGSNLSNVGNGKFAIFSGDINQDGSVDFNDYPALDISSNNGDLGYYATDLNGDASVDFIDYPLLDINSNNGVIAIRP